MTAQLDMFAGTETDVRSFPPYADPARVHLMCITAEDDRDHVAAPVNGQLPIGAVGNNRTMHVLTVYDHAEKVLGAWSFTTRNQAWTRQAELEAEICRNRQTVLL